MSISSSLVPPRVRAGEAVCGQSANGTPPVLSIFIVGYQSAEFIERCIEAIAPASRRRSYEVLLIDNGDGSTALLVEGKYPEVRIVPSMGNIGFAAGNNRLAHHARGAYFLLLNPDMQLNNGAIDALLDGAERHPAASVWGGVSLGADGAPDTGNSVAIPSLLGLLRFAFGQSETGYSANASLEKDAPSAALMGGLMMVRRRTWEDSGGLDERYFLYCEEVDLFYRLGKSGHSFMRVARAMGRHDAGHGDNFSPRRELYRVAGIMQFATLHWSLPARVIAALLIWLGAFGRLLAGTLFARFRPRWGSLARANRYVATRPFLWMRGYDPDQGLLARLKR